MAAADVDQIINNYWARELQGAKPAPSVMPQADVQVAAEEAPSRRLDAPSLATAELPTKGSAALDAEAPKAEAANPSLSPAQPPSPPPPEASPPAEVSEPAVVGGTNSLQGGMLAAAAGLGAGDIPPFPEHLESLPSPPRSPLHEGEVCGAPEAHVNRACPPISWCRNARARSWHGGHCGDGDHGGDGNRHLGRWALPFFCNCSSENAPQGPQAAHVSIPCQQKVLA